MLRSIRYSVIDNGLYMLKMSPVLIRAFLFSVMCLSLSACGGFISGIGPDKGDIANQATQDDVPRFELIDVDSYVIEELRHRGPDSFRAHFGDYRPSVEPLIGVGDMVSVTIWEAGPGGLFSAPLATDRFSTGANSATIPDQVVGRDGTITVPYAGRIPVIGHTTRSVQTLIENALTGKAIQPQALVKVSHSISNTVTVTGEVVNGALVPLSAKGDRVMDVIAEAGGIRAPVNETYVQLTRGPVTVRVAMSRVSSDAKENIYLRANDVLTLVRDPQTFIAYGATGKNEEIPFQADGINLSQALAKAGGLNNNQSDPAGVFVFRYEPEGIVRALRPRSTLVRRGYVTPVVYRFDLRDAGSLFLAQSFRIQNRDLLYVSNAPINTAQKVLEVVNLVIGPAINAAYVCTATRC